MWEASDIMALSMTPDHGDSEAAALSDDELIARHLCGRQDAFAHLFGRYERRVYAIAYRISGDRAEAEDLTQDTFLRAFRALPALRQRRAFAGWLYRIATTTCLDKLRCRAPRQVSLDATLAAVLPDEARWRQPSEAALTAEDGHALHAALRQLAPRQRTALTLHELQGLSYADTARAMDSSVDAVAILIFRGRRRLRERYAQAAFLPRAEEAS